MIRYNVVVDGSEGGSEFLMALSKGRTDGGMGGWMDGRTDEVSDLFLVQLHTCLYYPVHDGL